MLFNFLFLVGFLWFLAICIYPTVWSVNSLRSVNSNDCLSFRHHRFAETMTTPSCACHRDNGIKSDCQTILGVAQYLREVRQLQAVGMVINVVHFVPVCHGKSQSFSLFCSFFFFFSFGPADSIESSSCLASKKTKKKKKQTSANNLHKYSW